MASTITPASKKTWSVCPMSLQQVSLVVSWISAIDPNTEIDQTALATSMKQELKEARKIGGCEYFIGDFGKMPMYFMVGFACMGRSAFEVATILVNPLLAEALQYPVYQQAFQSIFKDRSIDRIVIEVEAGSKYLKSVMLRLGFNELPNSRESRRTVNVLYLDRVALHS
jgi:pectin methylesterase-like acyl-CoA thioesterase